jgi:O-methyltransferase involved in polyketide biosynthesis
MSVMGSDRSIHSSDGAPEKAAADLHGVPETLLWTLWQRAAEARRPDAVIHDPKAVELVEAIDYPFEERFGAPWMGQWQALRARCFDREVTRFLTAQPESMVVALGEGLETQFWRVDNGRCRWLTVDLAEVVDLRRRLLPASERQQTLACSVLDERWMDEVDASRGVMITAQGLLMYLQPSEVRRLIAGCAERFPTGTLVFDSMPRWFTARTRSGAMKTSGGFRAPPMPWGMDADEREKIVRVHPNIIEVGDLKLPPGRGFFGRVAPWVNLIPVVRTKRPSIIRLRFGASSGRGRG